LPNNIYFADCIYSKGCMKSPWHLKVVVFVAAFVRFKAQQLQNNIPNMYTS